jgi:hypothetical protein
LTSSEGGYQQFQGKQELSTGSTWTGVQGMDYFTKPPGCNQSSPISLYPGPLRFLCYLLIRQTDLSMPPIFLTVNLQQSFFFFSITIVLASTYIRLDIMISSHSTSIYKRIEIRPWHVAAQNRKSDLPYSISTLLLPHTQPPFPASLETEGSLLVKHHTTIPGASQRQ